MAVVGERGRESVVVNWKSGRRRSAHLLAEQTVKGVSLAGGLIGREKEAERQMPKPEDLRASMRVGVQSPKTPCLSVPPLPLSHSDC